MQLINGLSSILKQSFGWDKARIDWITRILISLIKTSCMNLSEITTDFSSNATLPDSHYRYI